MRYILTENITIPAGSVCKLTSELGGGGLEVEHEPGERGCVRVFLGRAAALREGMVVAKPELAVVEAAPEPTPTPLREVATVMQDPVAALRKLADELEASPEAIHAIGVVTLTGPRNLTTYGYGPDGHVPEIALMFTAAVQRSARGYN